MPSHSGGMKIKRLSHAVALAACSFTLGAPAADNTLWVQITPAGHFLPADGREINVPSWHIDQAVAAKVIERFRARQNKRVVDYEHQTLLKEENGQPAPAAGWYLDLEWREGQGCCSDRTRSVQVRAGYGYLRPAGRGPVRRDRRTQTSHNRPDHDSIHMGHRSNRQRYPRHSTPTTTTVEHLGSRSALGSAGWPDEHADV